MLVEMETLDVRKLKAEGDTLLLATQQQYEGIIKALGEVRDNYADAIVAYESGRAEKTKELMVADKKLGITAAKELGRDACAVHYDKMIHLEQMKKKLQGYERAIRERLQTFKIILKIRYSDLEGH